MADVLKDVNHLHPLEDFIEGGNDLLPSGLMREKPDFMAFLKVYLERLKAADEMMVSLAEGRLLLNATGLNLDEIGQQEGVFRNGLEDPEYRAVILIITGSSGMHGTRPEVISVLRQIFGRDNFATYKGDNFRFDINIFDSCFEVDPVIPNILELLPLPTHLRVTEAVGFPFAFEGDDQAEGFGSIHVALNTELGGFARNVYVSDNDDPYR